MEDRYGMIRQHSGIWRSLRDGDFEEEEVWDVLRDRNDHRNSEIPRSKVVPSSAPIPVPRPLPTAARMIQRASSSNNSSTSSSHETHVVLQQSAPVNIPDWSKIHSKNHKNKMKTSQNDEYGFDDDDDDEDEDKEEEEEEEEEDDEFDVRLPPHEVISRRLARSQISSFSVFEGVGRTLKGRDLSKVRNAILNKTGFLESL